MFLVQWSDGGGGAKSIEIMKTILTNVRKAAPTLHVERRYQHSDAVTKFVLSVMELVSMPSLVWFLKASA